MALILTTALRSTRGTLRLIGLRWLLWILAGLPGMLVARGALDGAVANRPFYAEAPDPLPLAQLGGLMSELGGGVWGALVAGAVVAWLFNLLLTAAAFRILGPEVLPADFKVLRMTFDTGTRFLWAYLRVALLALLAIVVGARLLGAAFDGLADYGTLHGWTGRTQGLTLPMWRSVLLLGWVTAVGVCAFWSRAILVADGRRHVRRIVPLLPRLLWRYPLHGLVFHAALALVALLLGAPLLLAWRQSAGSTTLWTILWLAVLLFQAWLWRWRVREACLVWASPPLEDLRAVPDEPWHLWRRIRRRGRPGDEILQESPVAQPGSTLRDAVRASDDDQEAVT